MITDEEFAERKRLADRRAVEARDKLEEARAADIMAACAEDFTDSVRDAIEELRDYKGRAQEVNDVVKALIRRIEYEKSPETGAITLSVYFI